MLQGAKTTEALAVTFLIPLFALVWGAVFLGEEISLATLIGCTLMVLTTWLVAFQSTQSVAKEA